MNDKLAGPATAYAHHLLTDFVSSPTPVVPFQALCQSRALMQFGFTSQCGALRGISFLDFTLFNARQYAQAQL
jgi:hypothetical protein